MIKIKSLTFGLALLGLALGLSWQGSAAQASVSPRRNPAFWGRFSGVVSFAPGINLAPAPANRFLDFGQVFEAILAVPTGPNVLANQDATVQQQNEPSIAVNPNNPAHVIASSNDYRLRQGSGDVHPGYYVSFDGGHTWPGDGIIDLSQIPDNPPAGGDPAMAIYDANHVYFAYIAFHRTLDEVGGVFVSKSTDGGLTWLPPVEVAHNSSTVFHDKEYIAVDATGGPYDGNVYVSWTRFEASYPIYFARSTDGGASFSTPYQISDSAYCQGSVPAVAPNGDVFVVWYDYMDNSAHMARSTNGGLSFGTPFTVAAITPIPSPLPGGSFRNNSFPVVAISPTNGSLYVVWNDYRNGDADIYLTRSTNNGASWSPPVRLNDDPLGNDAHQFFPWVTVAPNGTVYVGWFDSRHDPDYYNAPFIYDAYVTRSTDNGLSWEANARISTVSSDATIGFDPNDFIGDYSGIAATNEFVYPAWVDTRRGHQDIFTQAYPGAVEGLKSAPGLVEREEVFTYEINLVSGEDLTGTQLSDPLPFGVTYVPGSAWASSGNIGQAGERIVWDGDLTAGAPVTITFEVTATGACGLAITNTAVFTGGVGGLRLELTASSLISGSLPTAGFAPSDATPLQGQVVTFTNQSSGALSYLWDFGDGFTSTLESPTHTFALAGDYAVSLRAANTCGLDIYTQTLRVICDPPTPSFSWEESRLVVTFTNQTTSPFPLDFLWDFGDGISSSQVSPVHPYALPGAYAVRLTASNVCGVGLFTETVTATCPAPTAGFAWQAEGLTVTFTNQSEGMFALSYLWDFGDGVTSTLESPLHTYAASGTYTVTLTASDACGLEVYQAQVTVEAAEARRIYVPMLYKGQAGRDQKLMLSMW